MWLELGIGFVLGVAQVIIGFYLIMKYIMPRMTRDSAIAVAEALLSHEKVQPAIKKLRELEPMLEKVKELDLQELVDLAKGVKVFIELQNAEKEMPPPPRKKGG